VGKRYMKKRTVIELKKKPRDDNIIGFSNHDKKGKSVEKL